MEACGPKRAEELAIDAAASEFYEGNIYKLKKSSGAEMDSDQLIRSARARASSAVHPKHFTILLGPKSGFDFPGRRYLSAVSSETHNVKFQYCSEWVKRAARAMIRITCKRSSSYGFCRGRRLDGARLSSDFALAGFLVAVSALFPSATMLSSLGSTGMVIQHSTPFLANFSFTVPCIS